MRKDGTVSIVGVYGPTFNAVPIGIAVNKGLTLRMNQTSVKRHFPRLIEHLQAGRIEPSEVISQRFALEDIADAHHVYWMLLLAPDRINVGEGLLADLAQGHIPNIFAEMGGPAEWRHNRAGFVKTAVVVIAAAGTLVYLMRRRKD